VRLNVHVVGYAVDDATRERLECVAAVLGGSYHDATDAAGLLLALDEALAAAIVETVLPVELQVTDGTDQHASVHLYQAGTDRLVSDYTTWKDNLVPPGDYDLVVDTMPKLAYEGLTLPEGSTTVMRIVVSAIRVVVPDGRDAPSLTSCIPMARRWTLDAVGSATWCRASTYCASTTHAASRSPWIRARLWSCGWGSSRCRAPLSCSIRMATW
jgi:hypothetical protein